jgi:hypothetical protein
VEQPWFGSVRDGIDFLVVRFVDWTEVLRTVSFIMMASSMDVGCTPEIRT